MRFDPKLIQPDDAPLDDQGEIELPDDLGELAAQLRDDALFLAARYPASAAVTSPAPVLASQAAQDPLVSPASSLSATSQRPWIMAVTGAAALCLLVVAGLYRPTSFYSEATPPSPSVKHVLAQDIVQPIETTHPAVPLRDVSRTPISTRPVTLLINGGVSGPELEGLLDLWQSAGEQDPRISF